MRVEPERSGEIPRGNEKSTIPPLSYSLPRGTEPARASYLGFVVYVCFRSRCGGFLDYGFAFARNDIVYVCFAGGCPASRRNYRVIARYSPFTQGRQDIVRLRGIPLIRLASSLLFSVFREGVAVQDREVDDFGDCGYRPRARIQQIQRNNGMEMRENRENPRDTEHARSHNYDNRRHEAFS